MVWARQKVRAPTQLGDPVQIPGKRILRSTGHGDDRARQREESAARTCDREIYQILGAPRNISRGKKREIASEVGREMPGRWGGSGEARGVCTYLSHLFVRDEHLTRVLFVGRALSALVKWGRHPGFFRSLVVFSA